MYGNNGYVWRHAAPDQRYADQDSGAAPRASGRTHLVKCNGKPAIRLWSYYPRPARKTDLDYRREVANRRAATYRGNQHRGLRYRRGMAAEGAARASSPWRQRDLSDGPGRG